MFEEFNFEPGKVVFNYLGGVDINMTIKEMVRLVLLDEDLFYAEYGKKYAIDVGWYSNRNKTFWVRVMKDDNWENPIYDKSCRDLKTLNEHMKECVEMVKRLLENGSSVMT